MGFLSSDGVSSNVGDVLTISAFTIGSQSRRWMMIHVHAKFSGGAGGSVTSITVGGTDMVSNTVINAPAAQDEFRQVHTFFVNEADFATLGAGDHDIVATYNPNNTVDHMALFVQYFDDIDQTIGAVGAVEGSETTRVDGPFTLDATPDAGGGNNFLIGATLCGRDEDIDWSSTDGTEVEDQELGDASNNARSGCMHSPLTGTSALTASWDVASTARHGFTACIIHEDLGVGGAARPQGPLGHPLTGAFGGPM